MSTENRPAPAPLQVFKAAPGRDYNLRRCLVVDVRDLPDRTARENPRVAYVAVSPSTGQPFGNVYSCSATEFARGYVPA